MKKIFSFVVVLAAVAMVGCCGNSNKKAADAAATEAVATDAAATEAACEGCTEECDSTANCEKAAAAAAETAETTEAAK